MKNKSSLILFIIIFNFIANLANDSYLPSLPYLTEIFKTSPNIMQLSMTAWFIGIAFPQLIFGPLSDHFGNKLILFIGSGVFIFSTILCSLSNNIIFFIIARLFQGVGVCCINVTSYSIFVDLYKNGNFHRLINVMNTLCSLSPIIGPMIGGYLFVWFGWQANFILIAIASSICLTGLYMNHLIIRSKKNNELDIKFFITNYINIVKDKYFLKQIITYCLILGGLVTYITASPFIFIGKLHVQPQLYGYIQLFIFSAYLLGSLILFALRSENNEKIFVNIGIGLILFSGIIMLITVNLSNQYLITIIFAMMLYTLGLSLSSTILISKIMLHNIELKGYTSALLGFNSSISCVSLGIILSLSYTGILSFAIILFVICAVSSMFFYLL